jgi:hypothetical protein
MTFTVANGKATRFMTTPKLSLLPFLRALVLKSQYWHDFF